MAFSSPRQMVACPLPHDEETERPKMTKCIPTPTVEAEMFWAEKRMF